MPSAEPTDRIRVALVITELDLGGAERALVQLATGLDRSQWEPRVIALGPEAPFAQVLRAEGVQTVCLDGSTIRAGVTFMKLVREIQSFRPRVVQSFLFHANLLTRFAASLAGRPIVVAGVRVADREHGWHVRLERATNGLVDRVVCVSEEVRRFLIEAGWPASQLQVIPNAVDPARFEGVQSDRRSLSLPEGALMVAVGRVVPQKGYDLLLRAFHEVLKERPNTSLAIVGEGAERARLEAETSADPTLASRVYWLGFRDDVPAILRSADLFVLASRWEGMPNVVLEAMAAGCPVATTPVEGTRSLIGAEERGWFLDSERPELMARVLIDAFDNADERNARVARARAYVADQHAPQSIARAYEDTWSALLLAKNRPKD